MEFTAGNNETNISLLHTMDSSSSFVAIFLTKCHVPIELKKIQCSPAALNMFIPFHMYFVLGFQNPANIIKL